ncbi:MAG: hypothetical protein HONBIEJF_01893 [Fimbriimonadaceae bacterium]|nr:hypothetical protein [Fimbriimonadaceae bacterium]
MIVALVALALLPQPDILIADFEGETYGDWVVTGAAFGHGPAKGTLAGQMAVSGFLGRGLVNTYFGGDTSTGTLTSPPFQINRRYLSFLIGGGHDRQRLSLDLFVGDQIVRKATGPNRTPGGTEALELDGWDLKPYLGKMATLRIVDEATGGWGHVNVDHILLTDQKPPMSISNATKKVRLDKRFLLLPIKNGATRRLVTVAIDGMPPVVNEVELADQEADWFASLDVTAWKGRAATISVDRLAAESKAMEGIRVAAAVPEKTPAYEEAQRGQFHFSPRRGWNNDPNGMVFFNGEYHLFFQHNPYGWGWGNMHWGHAVSKDLVHWEELPIALFPDSHGTMWSGSAVVDWQNSSGFGTASRPPMVLFYTAAGDPFVQGVAYSTDGRTFVKWSGNPSVPFIETGNRDPKVFWHEPSRRWVMVLYLEIPNKPTMQFLVSRDLKQWEPTSRIEGFHECPDLFELPIENRRGQSRWVLSAANSDYQVGTFDGRTFTPETPILKGHQGRGFYAAQTFSDVPGRRIQMGWFQTETKGMPFNQSMSLPLELGLIQDGEGPRMTWTPVPELHALRSKTTSIPALELTFETPDPLRRLTGELVEIELEFEPLAGSRIELTVRGLAIKFDTDSQTLEVGNQKARCPLTDGKQNIRVFCDRTGYEIFAAGGRTFVPLAVPPKGGDRTLSLRTVAGTAKISKLLVHQLRSAWRKP